MDDGCADLWDEGLPRDAGPLVFLLTPLLVLQGCQPQSHFLTLYLVSLYSAALKSK